ncbi:hypothetical protein M2C68_22370, partial [Pseudomonas sp. BAgro211]|nr:hypothetical protein [Pseudomonas sp. BAgro211]
MFGVVFVGGGVVGGFGVVLGFLLVGVVGVLVLCVSVVGLLGLGLGFGFLLGPWAIILIFFVVK